MCLLLFTGAWVYFTHNTTAKAFVIYQSQKDTVPDKIRTLIQIHLLDTLNEKFNFGMVTRAYRPIWTYKLSSRPDNKQAFYLFVLRYDKGTAINEEHKFRVYESEGKITVEDSKNKYIPVKEWIKKYR